MKIANVHTAIALLARNPASNESLVDYETALPARLAAAKELIQDHELDKITVPGKPILQYVYGCTYVLAKLMELLEADGDSASKLISIKQQQNIKTLLQLIFSVGVTPCLSKGVNVPLLMKTAQLKLLHKEEWSTLQKHLVFTFIVDTMIDITKCSHLRPLVLERLGDLISALLQLIHCGKIKEPTTSSSATSSGTDFVMTKEWHEKLAKERAKFTADFNELVGAIYKPLVIRELLILLMPNRPKELPMPRWFDRATALILHSYLMGPGGISHVIRACCPSDSEVVDWRIIGSLAKLITVIYPGVDIDNFYSSRSPQLISLLNTTGAYCVPVAKACIIKLLEKDKNRWEKYLLDKLFEPLIICSKPITGVSGTLISEDALTRCIENISKCFTTESRETAVPLPFLLKVVNILFKLYMTLAGKPFKLVSTVEDLLVRYLNAVTEVKIIGGIYNALMFDEPYPNVLSMNRDLAFELGPSGGVQVVRASSRPSERPIDGNGFVSKFERPCEILFDLLDKNESYRKSLLYKLFYALLTKLFFFMVAPDTDTLSIKPDLFSAEELIFYILAKKEKKLMTIKLLADLSEHDSVKESIRERPDLAVKFIAVVLEKIAYPFDNSPDDDDDDDDEEEDDDLSEIIIPLSIIDIATLNLKVGSKDWALFDRLLPSLLTIKDKHHLDDVRKLFSMIYERIVTRGAVNREPLKDPLDLKLPFMGSGNDAVAEAKVPVKESKKIKAGKKKVLVEDVTPLSPEKEFENVIDMICSEEVPLKGHGLVQLEKIIRMKNPAVIKTKTKLFEMLKQLLKDPDSYVYLAVVPALEALCNVDLDGTIRCLCEEYTVNKKDCTDFQLKVGEVLVRISRNCANIGAQNKDRMINTFLYGARSSDEFLRASSLSNLGELLKNMGYSSSPILQEVFVCVKSISLTDKSNVVRRSAILVANLLINGYLGSSFLGLEPILRDLHRVLVHVARTDNDEIVRIHAQRALRAIDTQVQAQLYPTKPLEKKISILNLQS